MNRKFSIAIAAVITVAALAYSVWGIDLSSLRAVLSNGEYWTYLPFLLALSVFYILKAHRWAIILRPLGAYTWWQVFPAMMIGFGGNNVFPAHLGEIARIYFFSRQHRKPLSGVFISLVLERTFDVVAILCIYAVAVNTLEPDIEALRIGAWIAACGVVLVCLGIYSVLRWPGVIHRTWRKVGSPLPEAIKVRGDWLVSNFFLGFTALRSPAALCYLLFNSLAQWLIMGVLAWLSLRAFGEAPTFLVTVLLVAATTLAVTVPSAPGYFGAMQAAFVFALTPFGVPQEIALAASVLFLVGQWIPVTATGFLCFLASGLRLSEAREAVEQVDHGAVSAT